MMLFGQYGVIWSVEAKFGIHVVDGARFTSDYRDEPPVYIKSEVENYRKVLNSKT